MKNSFFLIAALMVFGCKESTTTLANLPPTDTGNSDIISTESYYGDGSIPAAPVVDYTDQDSQTRHIVLSQNWKQLHRDIYGVNGQTANTPAIDTNPDFLTKIGGLSLGNFRWPGGTIGNYFDWRTGKTKAIDAKDPNGGPTQGNMTQRNTYGLSQLKWVLNAAGATPIFMLNMLTDILPNQLEMLSTAKQMGMPIKYIELGNEFYLSYAQGGDNTTGKLGDYANVPYHYPTAKSYADSCEYYIAEIKKRFPEAMVAFHGVIDEPTQVWFNSSPRSVEWNKVMKQCITSTNIVIMHDYPNVDDYPNHGVRTPAGALKITLDTHKANRSFIETTYPGYEVWFTEYNNKTDTNGSGFRRNLYAGQWIHGMIASLTTAYLLSCPQVKLTCIHDIVSGVSACLIYDNETNIPVSWDNTSTRVTGKTNEYSAAGVAHALLGKVAKGSDWMQLISVTNNPMMTTEKGNIETLHGAIFYSGNTTRAFIVNLSDQMQRIGVANLRGVSTVESHHTESLNKFILTSTDCSQETITHFTAQTIDLHPFSITIMY